MSKLLHGARDDKGQIALSGRLVASWTAHERPGIGESRWLDTTFRTDAQLARDVAYCREQARANPRRRVHLAIAAPGSPAFVCMTLKADRLGRVRETSGWDWPNGNRLISSNSVLGVRRQLKRRKAATRA